MKNIQFPPYTYEAKIKEYMMAAPVAMRPLDIDEAANEVYNGFARDLVNYIKEHNLRAEALHMVRLRLQNDEPHQTLVEDHTNRVLWQEIRSRVKPIVPNDGGFDEKWDDPDFKPQQKTAPGHRTIEEIIVMRDFLEMVKPPRDFSMWNDRDKRLLDQGVRVGQLWRARTPSSVCSIAPIGYHQKGFVWVEIKTGLVRGSWNTVIKANKAIDGHRAGLSNDLRSGAAVLLCTIQSRCLDKDGFALPGWEVEAALSPLFLRPMFWKDTRRNTDVFLTFCSHGHIVFSSRQLAIGCPCGPDCIDSKRTEAAASLFDMILDSAIRTDPPKSRELFVGTCQTYKIPAFAPYSSLESKVEGKRITDAFSSPEIQSPAWIPIRHEETVLGLSTRAFHMERVRSGNIFPLQIQDTGESLFAKAHRRACGYFHFELSRTMTFSGETDKALLVKILRASRFSIGEFGKDIELSQLGPMMRCPICKSEDPILLIDTNKVDISNMDPKKYRGVLHPITHENIKKRIVPNSGDIIFCGKKPMIVEAISDSTRVGITDGLMVCCSTHRGDRVRLKLSSIKIPDNPSPATRALFYDSEGFILQRRLGLSNWMKAITTGTKLIATREDLFGLEVTCASAPFKMGSDWFVSIVESIRPMSLHTELRTKETFPISLGAQIRVGHKNYEVEDIQDGTIHLFSLRNLMRCRIPKIGLDILLRRKAAQITINVDPISAAFEAGLITSGEAAMMTVKKIDDLMADKRRKKVRIRKKKRRALKVNDLRNLVGTVIAVDNEAAPVIATYDADLEEWLNDDTYGDPAPIPDVPPVDR